MRSLHGSLNKPGPEEVNHTFIQQTLASFLTCTADLTSVMSALEQMVDQSSGLSFIQTLCQCFGYRHVYYAVINIQISSQKLAAMAQNQD